MKKLLLQLVAVAATLLPLSQAQAIGLAGKNYYGLNPGKKFTLKVTNVVSTQGTLSGVKEVPVPKGIPKFKKNAKVKFTIGSKGELKGPGFSIPFLTADATTSGYSKTTANGKSPDIAAVKKDTKLKPVWSQLTFYKFSGSGMGTKTNMVVYLLE